MKKEKNRIPKNPALSTRASDSTDHSRSYDKNRSWHEPVTAEDRREAALLDEAAQLGFRLATRCTRCNQWVVNSKSVSAHMGPVCRARMAEQ